MKSITQYIPNTITCCNLFAGCLACLVAFRGEFAYASYFVILAAIFDFFDGLTARLFKAYSPMGKELDSLADMVSFGLAPGFVLYSFLSYYTNSSYWSFAAFLIPVFSALRLAKFNIDLRQTSSFIGLPTPANAIFWVFLISGISQKYPVSVSETELLFVKITSVVLIAIFSYLLVAEVPMFSLKFKNFCWKKNKIQVIFLLGSLALLIALQLWSFPFIIGLYILLSLLNWAYLSLYGKSRTKV